MKAILSVKNLSVRYKIKAPGFFQSSLHLRAVEDVSFELGAGEILGLVGESGCGKSSLARAIVRLVKAREGEIFFGDADILKMSRKALRAIRPAIQMVFQDPYSSLDPRQNVRDILSEPIYAHESCSEGERLKRVKKILDLVGLSQKALSKFPHEFSGGQRQRIAIGRALILNPKIIIADEPVSSLDVSVQAQILNLLKEVQKNLGLSMIFISHNLAVVKYISNRIAVMYLGKIVEIAEQEDLYRSAKHPYTQALLAAVPIPDPRLERMRQRVPLEGEIPSALNFPSGCAFHTRCPIANETDCQTKVPKLEPVEKPSWLVSCWEVSDNSTRSRITIESTH